MDLVEPGQIQQQGAGRCGQIAAGIGHAATAHCERQVQLPRGLHRRHHLLGAARRGGEQGQRSLGAGDVVGEQRQRLRILDELLAQTGGQSGPQAAHIQ